MWLGKTNGYLQDWITQQWVKITGRKIDLDEFNWLAGPIGRTDVIDDTFIQDLCEKEGLRVHKNLSNAGLLESFDELKFMDEERNRLQSSVAEFYEQTSNYKFEFWSHWCGAFYPFGWLINRIFSKRLQQLNLPLNPMDSSKGIESNILKLKGKDDTTKYTVWYRILKAKNDVIYSGIYTHIFMKSVEEECLKVSFPLPNGNATVIMKKKVYEDGSVDFISKGKGSEIQDSTSS